MPGAFKLHGQLDVKLEQALTTLVERHESLRTTIVTGDSLSSHISAETSQALTALCQREGATLFMGLQAALPEPDLSQYQAEYIAPRTETEKVLCEIWQEVLGIERVGVTDNFFQLGGHSLLATVVVTQICTALSKEFTLRLLFELPTIDLISKYITENTPENTSHLESHDPHSPKWIYVDKNLSMLKSHRLTDKKVLLIPGAGGSVDIFDSISRKLVSLGIDVYSMHYDGVDNNNSPLSSIEEMAELCFPQILKHCGEELLIAGYCMGGMIGYELSHKLHRNGKSPQGLFLWDTDIRASSVFFDEGYFKSEFLRRLTLHILKMKTL